MALVANAGQQELWNGQEGRRWSDHHRRLDRMAATANEHLFAAAGIGEGEQRTSPLQLVSHPGVGPHLPPRSGWGLCVAYP
jgi:hypothetical protein